MSVKHPFPEDIDVPLSFWGFTPKDLVRIGIASGVGWVATEPMLGAGIIGATTGIGLGIAVSKIKPQGSTVDNHLKNAIDLVTRKRSGTLPGVDHLFTSGIIADNGTAVGIVKIHSCDLGILSTNEQNALSHAYRGLFTVIDYPVEIHSIQKEVKLGEYPTSRDTGIRTDHYAVIRVPEQTRHQEEVEKRCSEVRNALNRGDLSAHHVTGQELIDLVETIPDQLTYQARPTELQSNFDELSYSKPLFVEDVKGTADLGWVSDILNADAPVDIVQVITPEDPKIPTRIERIIDRINAERTTAVTEKRRRELAEARDAANWMLDQYSRGEQLVRYGVYLYPKTRNRSELEDAVRTIKHVLHQNRVSFRSAIFRTHQAIRSRSPFSHDTLNKTRLVPAATAAMGLPFATQDRLDEGVCYGIDTRNGMPVTLDRFIWNVGHEVIAGTTGSGKSYESKLLLLRAASHYDELSIILIDPKPEYSAIEHHLQQRDVDVQRYSPEDPAADNAEELTDAVRRAYRQAIETDEKTIVVVDEAHRLLRNRDGTAALSTLLREARHTNTAVTLVTQTIDDFYKHQDGPDILKTVPCKILFGHESVDDSAANAFGLSPKEAAQLRNLARGDDQETDHSQAIIEVSGRMKTKLRIESTRAEHEAIEGGNQRNLGGRICQIVDGLKDELLEEE